MGRLVAIFAISALGAGFCAGLTTTSRDMQNTANHYYEEQHLADWRLLSTLGFTEGDVDALRAADGVDEVMAGYALDLLMEHPDGVQAARVSALPADTGADAEDYLNRPVLESGRLPAAADECLTDGFAGYKVGDVITVANANSADTLDLLAVRQFTVVGTAASPAYVSFQRGNTNIGDGKVNCFIYVTDDAFDSEYYLEVLVRSEARPFAFDDAYDDMAGQGAKALGVLGEARAHIRYDEMVADGTAGLNDARANLADTRAEVDEKLGEAEQALADAEQQLLDSEKQLADGWAGYNRGLRELADAERDPLLFETAPTDTDISLSQAEKDLQARMAAWNADNASYAEDMKRLQSVETATAFLALQSGIMQASPSSSQTYLTAADNAVAELRRLAAELNAAGMTAEAAGLEVAAQDIEDALHPAPPGVPDYAVAESTLADAVTGLQAMLASMRSALAGTKARLDATYAQLDAASAQIAQERAAYEARMRQLAERRAELADDRAKLANAHRRLLDAEAELADGRAVYEDGLAEHLEEKQRAEAELASAEREIAEAQAELDNLELPEWCVFTRDDNVGYSSFASDTRRFNTIAVVISVFIFLVAAVVCFATMTSIVEKERGVIGTLKTQGHSNGSVVFKYLSCAAIASGGGGAVGAAVGMAVFPWVVWNAYSALYIMPSIRLGGNALLGVMCVLASMAVTILAAVRACVNALRMSDG